MSDDPLPQWLAQGALDDAAQALAARLEAHPFDSRLWQMQAELASRKGQAQEAMLAYEQALRADPRNAALHASLGRLLLQDRNLAAARRHLEAARAYAPEDLGHTLALIELYVLSGERAEALSYIKEALSLDPKNARAFALLGQVLWLYGRWPEARAALLQSLELDPQHEAAHLALLQLALKKHDHTTAMAALIAFPEPPRHRGEAWYLQAACQYHQGNHPAARELWYAALAAGNEQALLPLAVAAPLVSPDAQARLKWLDLVNQGAQLLVQSGAAAPDQNLEWPLQALLPEAEPELASLLGNYFQQHVPSMGLRLQARETHSIGLLSSDLDDPAQQDWLVCLLSHAAHTALDWRLFYLHPGELPPALQPWAERCFQAPDHGEALCRLLQDCELSALVYMDLEQSLYYTALRAPAPLQWLWPDQGRPSGLAALPLLDEVAVAPLARVHTATVARSLWDLPRLGHLYLCPLTPEHWLPEFDSLVHDLLNLDRKAFVLGLRQSGSALHTRVMQRHEEILTDRAHRVRWLDPQTGGLAALVQVADLLIEAPEAGHPWACFQALSAGIPVLSGPGSSLRSQLSRRWLAKVDLPELQLEDSASLPARAVELVTDKSRRAMLKERLLASQAALQTQQDTVRALEAAMHAKISQTLQGNHSDP